MEQGWFGDRSKVAWTGPRWPVASTETVGLYKTTYTNPHPEEEVVQPDPAVGGAWRRAFPLADEDSADRMFERRWGSVLLERALERLQNDCAAAIMNWCARKWATPWRIHVS